MKTPQTKQKGRGFTIIEVMIVLTIAGLILLIVFLAVPALQRNSRNTQRTADVSKLLGGVNEYVANNSGAVPAACSGTTTVQFGVVATGSQANVGYYTGGCVTASPANSNVFLTTGAQTLTADSTHDYVIISTGAQCSAGAAIVGAARSVAAVYLIENGSNSWQAKCQAS